eukprot:1159398-Pelagomonas_calceolata.AAC.17
MDQLYEQLRLHAAAKTARGGGWWGGPRHAQPHGLRGATGAGERGGRCRGRERRSRGVAAQLPAAAAAG